MKIDSGNKYVTSDLLAAYLDGNVTAEEFQFVTEALKTDKELQELVAISKAVDEELGIIPEEMEILPMEAMAAASLDGNKCCLECEKYILKKHGCIFDEDEILREAYENKWLKAEGTSLHQIGRHLENRGFIVSRKYQSLWDDMVKALSTGEDVIAVVDGGELLGDRNQEFCEDLFIGQYSDHTVVVLAYDNERKEITIYDPNSIHDTDTYPVAVFWDAWADSKNYMLTINKEDMKKYVPNPIDLSDVVLTEDLTELREAIAENAHEVWAEARQAEGWTYGPHRDDQLKQTPDMVPYAKLPESEKQYDRDMAMKTIKLLKKLGYDLVKKQDTDLYKELMNRIKSANEVFYCPHCPKGERTPIYKYQVFCDKCGHKLDINWRVY